MDDYERCQLTLDLERGISDFDVEELREFGFRTVAMDPPWYERGGGKIKRGADRHYPIMKTPAIRDTILEARPWALVADSAHLYMWVTNTFLVNGEALWLASELGFVPKSLLTWRKVGGRIGLGYYFRGATEHILFCVRGKTRKTEGTHATIFDGPRARHSKKPRAAYDLIEAASPGAYLEMFARSPRLGWCVWGNEVQSELDEVHG